MDNLEMQKLSVMEEITREKSRIQVLIDTEDPELSFLSDIWESSEPDLLKVAAKANQTDLIMAIVLSDEKRTESFEYIQYILAKNKELFDSTDEHKMLAVLETFADLDNHGLYDILKESISPSENTLRFFVPKGAAIGLKFLLKVMRIGNIDIYPFMESIDRLPNFFDAVLCTKALQTMLKKRSKLAEDIDLTARAVEERFGLLNKAIKKEYNISEIKRIIYGARSYYDGKKRNSSGKKRAYRRELTAYETLEESIEKILSGGEIKNIKDLLYRISNPTFRLELLKMIYLHNKKIYDQIASEYQTLSSNKTSQYQSLLQKYDISPESYDPSSIMANTLDALNTMLQGIKNMGITEPSIILGIIQNSNETIIRYLVTQIEKGLISKELLRGNTNIFLTGSEEYNNLVSNLELFAEEGFNPHYLRANQELFFTSPEIIKNSIKVLKEYNLTSSMKTGMDCRFLSSSDLEKGIDVLLELGYESYLEEDLSLLSYQANFPRLRVLKALNIPISTKEELKDILTSEHFLVADDEIDSYLYNAVIWRLPLEENQNEQYPINLASYLKTPRTYEIAGVLISRNKVARNLNAHPKDLLSAITKDTVLSDEEFEGIIAELNQKSSGQFSKKASERATASING